MRRLAMRRLAALLCGLWLALLAAPALSVQPDEMLADPALEARARALSQELRCLICQNQSIDESDAELARDLRLLLRERLAAGDSDEEVLAFLVARYGEFILLKPRFSLQNALLWATPAIVLVLGGGLAFAVMRRRAAAPAGALSPEEAARLATILAENGGEQPKGQ